MNISFSLPWFFLRTKRIYGNVSNAASVCVLLYEIREDVSDENAMRCKSSKKKGQIWRIFIYCKYDCLFNVMFFSPFYLFQNKVSAFLCTGLAQKGRLCPRDLTIRHVKRVIFRTLSRS
jgi:hypothetical protein